MINTVYMHSGAGAISDHKGAGAVSEYPGAGAISEHRDGRHAPRKAVTMSTVNYKHGIYAHKSYTVITSTASMHTNRIQSLQARHLCT
jgi:hypothetical protein